MINIRSNIEKERYRLIVNRLSNKFEIIYSKKIKTILSKQYKLASDLVLKDKQADIKRLIDSQKLIHKKIIELQYKQIATVFSSFTYEQINKIKSSHFFYMKSVFWDAFSAWAEYIALKNVERISDTTKLLLTTHIKKGFESGLSADKVAEGIIKADKNFNSARAMIIARTETHSAAVNSMHTVISKTKIDFLKSWATFIDENTHGANKKDIFNHIIADGETVELDKKFVKTGEELDYPGDPINGSAGNIINCRCVVLYETA